MRICALFLLASGCALQLTGAAGGAVGGGTEVAWTGEVGGAFVVPVLVRGVTLGGALSGRGKSESGADWSGYLRAGYLALPEPKPWSLGWEVLGTLGARLHKGTFDFSARWYGGVDVGMIVYLSKQNDAEELNSSFLFIRRAFEMIPFARYQIGREREEGAHVVTHVFMLGVAFRLRLESNLL